MKTKIASSKVWLKLVLGNIIIFLSLVGFTEATLAFLYFNPPPFAVFAEINNKFYKDYDKNTLQFLPECGRYDSDLFYTLRPGSCRFENREFNTEIKVNSLGVRDDEDSLIAPEVIVLGDSHAMGWGVEEENRFSNLLKKEINLKILNTAISSYGTARQLIMLSKADTSNLKYLLIQYCDNDFKENRIFADKGNHLHISSVKTFNNNVKTDRKGSPRHYYFGKFLRGFAPILWQSAFPPQKMSEENRQKEAKKEVVKFLNVLNNSTIDLSNIKIIVFEINGHNRNDSYFINALDKKINKQQANSLNISTLDLSPSLTLNDYFILDNHMKDSGHRIVANELLKILN